MGFTPVLALERLVDNPVVLLEGPRPVGLLFKEASPMPPCMTCVRGGTRTMYTWTVSVEPTLDHDP